MIQKDYMNNFWKKLKKPILALAPMAGITDSAFREICRKYGADVVYSEMASVDALFFKPRKTLDLLRFGKKERPYVVQLFGKNPQHFAVAAQIINSLPLEKGDQEGFEKFCAINKLSKSPLTPLFQRGALLRPDGIDINFGCPAKKVFGHGSGCALMPQKELARKIISAVCENTTLPVSIKIRAGFKSTTAIDFIKNIQDLPFQAIMVHGRTYEGKFSGEVDFALIQKIKKMLPDKIVLANGGITEPEQAKEILKKYPEIDGLGIGRGVLGRPWIFNEIHLDIECPSYNIKKIIIEHYKLICKDKGKIGIFEIRKHLAWYVKGFAGAAEIRHELVQAQSLGEIKEILKKIE